MRSEKWGACLQAGLLAFFLSFGAVASLTTGFGMQLLPDAAQYMDTAAWLPVNIPALALCCGIAAVVFAVCCTGRVGFLPLCLLALGGGYLWFEGSLARAVEALASRISQVYHSAYGWDVVYWSGQSLQDADMTLALCALGIGIAGVTAWTVCRRITAIPAVVLGALPVVACLVVTDRVPETLYLFVFLLALVVLILSQTVRRQNAREGNYLAALVTVPVVAMLALLFWLIPRQSFALPDQVDKLFSVMEQTLAGGSYQGLLGYGVASQGQVDLESTGVRLNSRTPVMEVTAQQSGTLYLRGRAYDFYEGDHWASSSQVDYMGWPQETLLQPAGTVTVTTYDVHQDVYLPYYYEGMDSLYIRQNVTNREKLTSFTYLYHKLPAEAVEEQGGNSKGYGTEYTVLPETTRRWGEALLRRLELEQDTTVATARAIGDYVRASATYNTWTRRMPATETDFARWFIQDSDTGYCVHFASAAAVLLRAANIPARYVTGYMVETVAGQTAIVRQQDAHAWVEYWVKGVGWVILETTPSVGEVSEERPQTTTSPTQPQPSQAVQDTTPTQTPTATTPDAVEPRVEGTGGWLWLAVPLAVLAGMLAQWRVRVATRKRKRAGAAVNAQALLYWQEIAEISRLLEEKPPRALFELAQRAKFSRYGLEAQELAAFETYLHGAIGRLKGKPLYLRIFYRLVLAIW